MGILEAPEKSMESVLWTGFLFLKVQHVRHYRVVLGNDKIILSLKVMKSRTTFQDSFQPNIVVLKVVL